MHRYAIYIIDIIIPYVSTGFSIFLCSLSIPAIINKNDKYSAIKQYSATCSIFMLYISIFIK